MEENQPNYNINDNVPRSDQEHGLPQDILKEIMMRLPAKSLVRFKIVCKEWLIIISDLDHPELHFQRCLSTIRIFYQIEKPSRRRYGNRLIEDEYSLFKLDETNRGKVAKKVATLHLENVNRMAYFRIKVACKSLLLFQGGPPRCIAEFTYLYVYDTIWDRQKELPEFFGFYGKKTFYTMVYNASEGKYLVVVFVDDKIQGMTLFLYALNPPLKWRREGEGEGKGKWRKSKPPLVQRIGGQQHSSVDVQGVLYWIAQPPDHHHAVSVGNCFIQPMVVATEEFRERIEPPCQPQISDFCPLLEVKGSLGLLTVKDIGARDELYIWVLKDSATSSWIKQHTIALSSLRCTQPLLQPAVPIYHDFHPRLIVGSYMLLTMGGRSDDLFWYNFDTKELSEVHIRTDHPSIYCDRGCFLIDHSG